MNDQLPTSLNSYKTQLSLPYNNNDDDDNKTKRLLLIILLNHILQ